MGITWDDVRLVLAAIDAAPGETLELERGELRLVVQKRTPAAATVHAAGVGDSSGCDLTLRAPSVGIFRRASASTPSLTPATRVEAQQVLARLDVAGAMRDVRAPNDAAEVVRILVEDGEFVEYGQPLMILRGREENGGRGAPRLCRGAPSVGGLGGPSRPPMN